MCFGRRSTLGGSAGGRPGVGRTFGNPGWRGYRSRAPPWRRWSGPFYSSIFPISFTFFSNYELSGPGWQDSTLAFRTCPRGRRGGGIMNSCAAFTFSLCSAKKSLTLLCSFGFNHFSRLSWAKTSTTTTTLTTRKESWSSRGGFIFFYFTADYLTSRFINKNTNTQKWA